MKRTVTVASKKNSNRKGTTDLVKELSEQLKDGVKDVTTSENFKNYLTVMAKFYSYSANNCMLIWLQNPEATKVAGYNAWKTKFNRQVKAGEKGIRIFAPVPHSYTRKVVDANTGEEDTQYNFWTSFKPTTVFDISQTEGDDLPEICDTVNGEVKNFDELVNAISEVSDVPVMFEEVRNGSYGYYSDAEKKIVVKEGLPQAHTIKTMVHELTHSRLHCTGGDYHDADRDTKEIQAESVAFIVCNALGVKEDSYSFEYVSSWATMKGTEEVEKNLSVIQKTASSIIGEIEAKLA